MAANLRLGDEVRHEIHRLAGENLSMGEISRRLGIGRGAVKHVLRNTPTNTNRENRDSNTPSFEIKPDGTAVAVIRTDVIINTLDEVYRVGKIDKSQWVVRSFRYSPYTVAMRLRQGEEVGTKRKLPDIPIQTQQYALRVVLVPVMPAAHRAAFDALFARMEQHAPKWPTPPASVKAPPGEILAVVGMSDVHFGKHAWGRETGQDYDIRIAEAFVHNATTDMIVEGKRRGVGRWSFIVGSDYFHMDNVWNTTLNGTPQDVDGRYAKVVEHGEMAVISAIERMAAVAPVDVLWVPGNHDPTTSYHLARVVKAWFRHHPNVTVDVEPSPRKYVVWGRTLLGFTHGNEEKPADLPGIMAVEQRKAWATALTSEWIIGHMHRERQWKTQPVDTFQGTTVRVLNSMAGTDAWHHRKGYVGTRQAADLLFYSVATGYDGHKPIYARS